MFKGITPLFKQEEKSDLEKLEDECCNELCPKLTYAQRLAGYCACLGVSFALSLGSWTRLVALVHGEPVGFVAFYTLSNVVGIGGSMFLSGPAGQCRKMWDKERWPASAMYLLSIVATLFVCFYRGIPDRYRVGVIVAMLFVQWCAMLYFVVSFIPCAKEYCCLICREGPRDCAKWCARRK